jgi:hypothetical protein
MNKNSLVRRGLSLVAWACGGYFAFATSFALVVSIMGPSLVLGTGALCQNLFPWLTPERMVESHCGLSSNLSTPMRATSIVVLGVALLFLLRSLSRGIVGKLPRTLSRRFLRMCFLWCAASFAVAITVAAIKTSNGFVGDLPVIAHVMQDTLHGLSIYKAQGVLLPPESLPPFPYSPLLLAGVFSTSLPVASTLQALGASTVLAWSTSITFTVSLLWGATLLVLVKLFSIRFQSRMSVAFVAIAPVVLVSGVLFGQIEIYCVACWLAALLLLRNGRPWTALALIGCTMLMKLQLLLVLFPLLMLTLVICRREKFRLTDFAAGISLGLVAVLPLLSHGMPTVSGAPTSQTARLFFPGIPIVSGVSFLIPIVALTLAFLFSLWLIARSPGREAQLRTAIYSVGIMAAVFAATTLDTPAGYVELGPAVALYGLGADIAAGAVIFFSSLLATSQYWAGDVFDLGIFVGKEGVLSRLGQSLVEPYTSWASVLKSISASSFLFLAMVFTRADLSSTPRHDAATDQASSARAR